MWKEGEEAGSRVEAECGGALECQTKGFAVSSEVIHGTIVLRNAT